MSQNDLKNELFGGPGSGQDPLLSANSNDLPWHDQQFDSGTQSAGSGFNSYGYGTQGNVPNGSMSGAIGGGAGSYGGGAGNYGFPNQGVSTGISMGNPMGGMGGSIGDTSAGKIDFENEPPLLEELGINFSHITQKTLAVLIPTKTLQQEIMEDTDMAGPLFFCLLLGFCLLLTGKIHFGYIYGFGLIGCVGMYIILNLMSEDKSIDIYRTMSILGYCLLPIVALAAIHIFMSLKGVVGFAMTALTVLWCTIAATRFIEATLSMRGQRYLVAYPLMLLYSCFALITVF